MMRSCCFIARVSTHGPVTLALDTPSSYGVQSLWTLEYDSLRQYIEIWI